MTETHTQRDTHMTDTHTERDTQRHTHRERHTHTHTERERHTETHRHTHTSDFTESNVFNNLKEQTTVLFIHHHSPGLNVLNQFKVEVMSRWHISSVSHHALCQSSDSIHLPSCTNRTCSSIRKWQSMIAARFRACCRTDVRRWLIGIKNKVSKQVLIRLIQKTIESDSINTRSVYWDGRYSESGKSINQSLISWSNELTSNHNTSEEKYGGLLVPT